ncbi:uncharacterized protein LOC110433389 [Sorghum bicolor]|uniref:uncharacterized protein LOC110431571 n=1 Tax=Sorghum bicolor TaxID=4558 RepID=UPI000B42531F|nr:uncharacterized protein LOC110431571 [Sorghum bicolor]XP_021311045.1 uncharacterized protein LOC110433389 [Sorghum bicolor]XP_021311046.1 uncharacterized protein LOC110433389 [Sorghum bicolor]XP_021311047.1 uncharacterized protein LOC110433389 [Sorghum bicolor]|eukprot:XP_021306354.1 uncharacterized protein LOC110431571 [Sorghum bicolor]
MQQRDQQGSGLRSRAQHWNGRAGHASPGDWASVSLEGHAPAFQVPNDGSQRAEPPGAEDDVVPGQGHDEEVGWERLAIDEQGRVVDDALTGGALVVRDQGGEAWALAKRKTRAPRHLLRYEVVRAAGVEEGAEGCGAEGHAELHGARHGNTSHGLQGEAGASASGSAAPASSAASSISTPSRKKMRLQKRLWPREYFSLQLKQRPRRRRSAHLLWSEAAMIAVATGRLGGRRGCSQRQWLLGWWQSGPGAGAGRRPRAGALGGGVASRLASINSTCRARLMAAASDVGLWMRTSWVRGGRRPPVKSWTRCASSRRPARGRRAWNRLEYSSTVPVLRHSANSNRGADRSGGPNRRLRRSLKCPHVGVPSSS